MSRNASSDYGTSKHAYEFGILSKDSEAKNPVHHINPSTEYVAPECQHMCVCCNTVAEKTHRQSPINIIEKSVKFQEFRPFTFVGYEKLSIAKGTIQAKNTGGTLKLLADLGIGLLGGGPLNVQYEFVEMHYHWGDEDGHAGSEHKIDGKSYPLELHMVHKNIHDLSIDDALCHENGLCVLAFVFEVVDYNGPIPGLDMLTDVVIDHLIKANSVFDQSKYKACSDKLKDQKHEDINVANFLPFLIEEYFTYRGSLTTGGCEEAVNWVFFRTPLAIKAKHLRAFQSLLNDDEQPIRNNYRPTMPANNRPVYYHGEELLARDVISMGKPFGLRSVDPAPVIGGGKGGCYEEKEASCKEEVCFGGTVTGFGLNGSAATQTKSIN